MKMKPTSPEFKNLVTKLTSTKLDLPPLPPSKPKMLALKMEKFLTGLPMLTV